MSLNISFFPSFSPSLPKPFSKPLFHPPNSSNSTTTPQIFLPHLDKPQQQQLHVEKVEKDSEQQESDPILSFFKSQQNHEYKDTQQGKVTLRRNRRATWHLANFPPTDSSNFDGETVDEQPFQDHLPLELSDSPAPNTETGTIAEILNIARNLPENATLGEHLGGFVDRISEGECIELLGIMGSEGLVRECLYLFEWMGLQESSLVTPRACSVLFPILGREGFGDEVLVLFENLPKTKRFRDVCVYNSAISGLACCGRYDDAWRVFEALESNNVRPDHVTCSILITIMRKSGRSAKEAWEFFEKMNRKGVKMSLEAYGALVKVFCDEGLKKEALIIQSEMEKKGITSNVIIYNTLMDAYSKSDQVEEAEGLFLEMKEKGLQPTTSTYNILMYAYSRRMQPEVVEALISEMEGLGLKPNVKSYTCLISAYGRQRTMSDMAADAFLRMKKAGIRPTSHSYTALIHAYSVGGWHEMAYSTYESMKKEGIAPSIETYTTLLDALRRAGETDKLMEIWKIMIDSKIESTRVTYNIMLDGLAKHGLYVQARDVMYECGKMGLQPTVMTYNMLMNAYARGGQHSKLPQLLKDMAVLNLKPDSVTYSTMIYAYVRVRDFSRAFYYHKQMVKTGQLPEPRSYQKLRAILEAKVSTQNWRDRSAILGIVNSKFSLKPKRGKKDEFWKSKKRQTNRVLDDNRR